MPENLLVENFYTLEGIDQILRKDAARYNGQDQVRGFFTDSREADCGSKVFLALKGNCFDGHDYVQEVEKKGALAVVVEKSHPAVKIPQIVVQSSSQAYLDLAAHFREQLSIPVVAVIGSVGKTTTKDMIVHLLRGSLPSVAYTQKNFNNTIGLPKTIFEVPKAASYLVLELGINQMGEMDLLASCAQPDYVVISGFGADHLEFLKDEETVRKENLQVLAKCRKACFSYQDALAGNSFDVEKLKFHTFSKQDIQTRIEWSLFLTEISCPWLENFSLQTIGTHNAQNAVLAKLVVKELLGQDNSSFEGLQLTAHRSDMKRIGELKIFDDSYNANPTSLDALYELFYRLRRRKTFILGGMKELGEESQRFHQEAFEKFGDDAIYVGEEWSSCPAKKKFAQIGDVPNEVLEEVVRSEFLILKGSNSYKIWTILERIEKIAM